MRNKFYCLSVVGLAVRFDDCNHHEPTHIAIRFSEDLPSVPSMAFQFSLE